MSDMASPNLLASDWMHRGMDLAQEGSAAALKEAVRCFDEAIALRRTLPLAENPDFRYGLSAGWINRGDALARLGEKRAAEAIRSYDEALALLKTLPLAENPLFPRRLAIAWINRGVALQWQETSVGAREAVLSFREAIGVLEALPVDAITDRDVLLAGAWTNLAGLLAGANSLGFAEVHGAVRKALELTRKAERDDAAVADVGLRARHTLCRAAVRELAEKNSLAESAQAEAARAADDALELAEHWNFRGEFASLAREVFRFGCRLYGNGAPAALIAFLIRQLAPERFGGDKIALDPATGDAIQAAIFTALEKLQGGGFQFVAKGEKDFLLVQIESLRKVEQRLKEVRASQKT